MDCKEFTIVALICLTILGVFWIRAEGAVKEQAIEKGLVQDQLGNWVEPPSPHLHGADR